MLNESNKQMMSIAITYSYIDIPTGDYISRQTGRIELPAINYMELEGLDFQKDIYPIILKMVGKSLVTAQVHFFSNEDFNPVVIRGKVIDENNDGTPSYINTRAGQMEWKVGTYVMTGEY